VAAQHCWRCGGLEKKPEKKGDYAGLCAGECKLKVAELKALLPVCKVCAGSGKVDKDLEFNPDSPDQVADVLYRGAGLPARRYKGEETVRVDQLEGLVGRHPIVEPLVEFARVDADYQTVVRLRGGSDSRLHCVFDPLVGTGSGRVASKEGLVEVGTNAMNIPKPARRFVVPDEGMVFLYPDMAQIEGRAIAVLSKDTQLIQLFNDGEDLHILVRDDARRLGFAKFSRDQAKRLEYATAYGGGPEQVAKELNAEALRRGEGETQLTADQTKLLMEHLLATRFRGVARWQKGVEQQLLQNRGFRSVTGRWFEWNDYIYDQKTKSVRYEILKQAWSREPQDIGAWVLGDGMLDVWQNNWEKVRGLIHVHDALLFQTKEEDVEEASEIVTKALTREMWGMKFTTSVKVGRNWKEAS
jgi:DNA polymerase-1